MSLSGSSAGISSRRALPQDPLLEAEPTRARRSSTGAVDPYLQVRQTFANASSRSLASSAQSTLGNSAPVRPEAFGLGVVMMAALRTGEHDWDDPESGDKFDTLISDELEPRRWTHALTVQ